MKYVISFISVMILSAPVSFSQDSLYCFTKYEIVSLTNKIRLVEDSSKYYKDLNRKKDSLILTFDTTLSLYKQQIQLHKQRHELWRSKENEYIKIIKNIQPKWYENKYLWFGIGILTASIIF